MVYQLQNEPVAERVDACLGELEKLAQLIEQFGTTSPMVAYLTHYAIIRSCGTLEFGFKTLISDQVSQGHSQQISNYFDTNLRSSSMNPSFDNICSTLKSFDSNWVKDFKKRIPSGKIRTSLQSLNDLRNSFAHGGQPSTTFLNVKEYFEDAVEVLQSIEQSIT